MGRVSLAVVVLAALAAAGSAWPQYRAALRAYRTGDTRRAQDLFERVVREHPRFTDAYYYLATLADRRGDRAEADKLYTLVQVGRATYPLSQIRLGEHALERGDRYTAERHFAAVVEASPRARAYLRLASVQIDLGRFARARRSLDGCRVAAKDTLEFRVLECRLLEGQGRYAAAVRACGRVLELRPTGPSLTAAFYRRGLCLLELGRTGDAVRDLERVLDAAPLHVGALRRLAEIYRRDPDNDTRAALLQARLTRLEARGRHLPLPPSGIDQ